MNHDSRLQLNDSIQDIVFKLSEGNPGAVNVLVSLLRDGDAIDPDAIMGGGLMAIMDLDSLGIYGSAIWVLYKDVCGRQIVNLIALLRAYQLGFIESSRIVEASQSRENTKLDVPALLKRVQEELPAFGAPKTEVVATAV